MPNTTTYSLAQVRFNLGDIAAHPLYTEFEKELNECKRYYQTSYSYGVLPQTANDNNLNEATLDLPNLGAINHFNIRFPIRMVGDAKNIRIYSPISGVSGEAYNISAGTDLYQSNGTQIIVPWSIASPWRTNAKLTKNIYVDTMKRDGFVVVVDGGAYSTDRIKFHWVADADFSRSII
jgi:hypothetical protein